MFYYEKRHSFLVSSIVVVVVVVAVVMAVVTFSGFVAKETIRSLNHEFSSVVGRRLDYFLPTIRLERYGPLDVMLSPFALRPSLHIVPYIMNRPEKFAPFECGLFVWT